jgi:hypothetical protein
MPSSDRRIIPKPRSSSLTNRNKRSSQCHQQGNQQLPPPAARKYGSGNQLLVERTVPQSKQQQRKRTTAITKDISQTQRQAAHGVISMSEGKFVQKILFLWKIEEKEFHSHFFSVSVTFQSWKIFGCSSSNSEIHNAN